ECASCASRCGRTSSRRRWTDWIASALATSATVTLAVWRGLLRRTEGTAGIQRHSTTEHTEHTEKCFPESTAKSGSQRSDILAVECAEDAALRRKASVRAQQAFNGINHRAHRAHREVLPCVDGEVWLTAFGFDR